MRKTHSIRKDQTKPSDIPPAILLLPARSAQPKGRPTDRRLTIEASPRASRPAFRSNAPIELNPYADTARLAHDARNLLSAVNLYCELLAGPGVLAPGFRHYADDLRRVGQTGARLIEALAAAAGHSDSLSADEAALPFQRHPFPGIRDLSSELLALQEPLRALAGAEIQLDVECAACAGELALNAEDLMRILFNLVANTVEAMRSPTAAQGGGNRRPFLRITAQLGSGSSFLPLGMSGPPASVILSVRDNGPGIAAEDLPHIFDPGFSNRGGVRRLANPPGNGQRTRASGFHGLGLASVRQLVEAAGGSVRAVSSPGIGVRFDIELPIIGSGVTPQRPAGGDREAGGLTLLSTGVAHDRP